MGIFTKIKFLLLFFVFIGVKSSLGQVTSNMPTGGQNVSNDFSSVGPAPTYTALGDIDLSSTVATDFTTGANRRIRLNAPTGWQFETTGVSVAHFGARLTASSLVSVAAGAVIIQYTAGTSTANAVNTLRISGLRVRSTTKTLGTTVNIIRASTTNNGVINGFDMGAIAAQLSKVVGAPTLLQTLLPGQTNLPGSATGKTGTVTNQIAGATFPVVVNAVDYAFNVVATAPNQEISLSSTNPYPNIAGTQNLASGTTTFNISLNTAGGTTNYTITATDETDGSLAANTSSNIRTAAGPFSKLLVIFPGETLASGAPTGKTGTANAPVSAANYAATVYSVDDYFNRVASSNNITLSATGVTNATQPAPNNLTNSATTGRTFTFVFRTVGEIPNITATNNTTIGMSYNQVVPAVVPGAFSKLQILLPGESSVPFTTSGKTGSVTAQAAGVPFSVTVNAVDANWNRITTGTGSDVTVGITNTTATDAATSLLPADAALSAGTGTFSVTLRRAASQSLVATNLTTVPAMAAVTSSNVLVNRDVYNKLLITFGTETYAPGTSTGKTNTLTTIASNATTTVTVRAVDQYWNLVNDVTETVTLTSTDANIVIPTNNLALTAGVRAFSNVRFRSAGNQTITASTGDVSKNYTTDQVLVTAGQFAKFVVVLPGETSVEGITAGKSGLPDVQLAGQSFNVLIRATDTYGNTVTDATNTVTFTATNDIYAQLPPNTPLSGGVLNATATYRIGSTAVNRRLNVVDALDNSKTGASSNFAVNIGPYAGLLIVLPGETYVPGALTGKSGTPANQAIGVAFNVTTVRAVDAAFNTVIGINDEIKFSSNDLSGVMPANAELVNGVKNTWPVTLNSASTSTTLTATSEDDATKNYTTPLIVVLGASSASDFFRSVVTTGNWNNSSSWESSSTGGSWQPSTRTPTNASQGILVRNGNTISITANVTVDDVVVEAGGQVNLTGGTLTIANGAAANDFSVEGTFRYVGGAITTTGVLQFANGGKYQHAFTTLTGTIPSATWSTGSICEIVGYTNFAGDITGSNQTFSNFVWNAPNQTATGSPSLLSGFTARDFTVTSTGAGSLNLGSVGGSTTITRDYTQTAGTVLANKASGTQNLSLGGDFLVNGGSFALGNGSVNVTFNGGSQTIENAGPAIQFQNVNFTNGGTKTLNAGSFSVGTTGVLTLGASTVLNASGNLSLLSDASSSGTVAVIPSSSSITGNVTVQRFVSGGAVNPFRTYRMFSSPIHTGSNTYDLTQLIDDIHITGSAANGFDDVTPSTSAWYYDATTTGFKIFPNTSTPVLAGNGVYVLYRGDRTSNLAAKFTAPAYSAPENVVMDFTGVLNQQNVSVPLSYSASITGFNFLGNPYASSIDWNTVISSGATADLEDNVVSIWNPAARQYATYDGSNGANQGSRYIPAGQGFFVQAKSSGGTFTFNESHKSGSMPSNLLMSAPVGGTDIMLASTGKMAAATGNFVAAAPQTELRTWLKKDNTPYKVENVVIFKEGKSADYVLKEDVKYLAGSEVFMSSLTNDGKRMVINYMPEVSATSKVNLDLDVLNATGNYTLEFNFNNVPSGYLVKLTDNFLHTSSYINNGATYNFAIDKTQEVTAGANRFSVAFEAPTTLPVTYSSFSVAKVNEGVVVKWNTQTETNNNRFEVERAGDDKAFVKLHTEFAKGSGSAYSYIDKNPLLGNNYYRLVQVDNDNKSTANQPQVINFTGEINGDINVVSIFPNPVVSKFTVKYNGALQATQQTLKIVNATGQVLLTKTVNKAELAAGYDIDIASYATGVYIVEVYEGGNQRIGQMKLVKQ